MAITSHDQAAPAGLSDTARFGAILTAQRSSQPRRTTACQHC